jgi:hypothetical protein
MPRARFGEGMASGRLIDLALERDIGLATATGDIDLTTDVGRMVARILAAVASAETERNAERQILANDLRVAAGKPQWIRRPFGYEMEGTLREAEAAAVLKAYHDVLAGKALTTVAREWNEAGFRTSAPDAATARPRAPRKNDYDPSGLWNRRSCAVCPSGSAQHGEVDAVRGNHGRGELDANRGRADLACDGPLPG